MEPHLARSDKQMFYKYLDKCKNYFEFGSGGSTYQASIRNNIRNIYSVESDIEWQNKLKQLIKNKEIKYIFNDMRTLPNTWGKPGKDATILQKTKYSEHMKNLINCSNNIAFVGGSSSWFNENMSGFGGTQLCVLHIAKILSKNYNIYLVNDKTEKDFVGESGIHYVRTIDETNFKVIIDVRHIRNKFLDNVVYIHWIHDPFLYNKVKKNEAIKKYDHVITLTNIQKKMWDKSFDTFNFKVINNPFILEPVQKKNIYNKYKIIAFSSKTNWNKCIKIVQNLRQFDKRFTLHVCSPSYFDISQFFKQYDFIINHGSLSHSKMMELLSDAFVCLYPTNFQESFGCVCYECMYYGVPMLTEYVEGSGLNEIIPKNLIFPTNCDINLYTNLIFDWYNNDTRPQLNFNYDNVSIYNKWQNLINYNKINEIDLIFIDGRFRVACCLKCHDIINDDCLIAFDDFLNRQKYHIVLTYFDIIEKTNDNIMVILKKKTNLKVPKEIIEKYELIQE